MKRLPALLLCIALAVAAVACGQDKGKAPTEKKATTQAQKKATKAQKKAPTQAQKKQQDRTAYCNTQANLRNMRGEDRKRFVSSCLRGKA